MTQKPQPGMPKIPRYRILLNLPAKLTGPLDRMRTVTGQSRSSFIAQLIAEEAGRRGEPIPEDEPEDPEAAAA